MRGGFELKLAPPLVLVQLSRERALYIPRASVVPLDQIAVIGVHDAHESGQVGSSARMQSLAQDRRRCGQLGNRVCDSPRGLLQAGGLNSRDAFRAHFGRSYIAEISPNISFLKEF